MPGLLTQVPYTLSQDTNNVPTTGCNREMVIEGTIGVAYITEKDSSIHYNTCIVKPLIKSKTRKSAEG